MSYEVYTDHLLKPDYLCQQLLVPYVPFVNTVPARLYLKKIPYFNPFHRPGMVKSHRIRFTSLMGVVDAPTAAENIITAMRRRAAIVFIPEIFYYVVNLVRVLPAKVCRLCICTRMDGDTFRNRRDIDRCKVDDGQVKEVVGSLIRIKVCLAVFGCRYTGAQRRLLPVYQNIRLILAHDAVCSFFM